MANIKKDFASPNGPILLLSAKGSTTASIAQANGVPDFSGNGNHGKGNNGVTVEKYGGYDCFGFPNNNSYIYLTDKKDTIFTQTSAYTFSVTFVITSKPTRANGILVMWSYSSPLIQIWITSDYKLRITSDNNFTEYNSSLSIEVNTIYTITVSANYTTGHREVWANGSLCNIMDKAGKELTINIGHLILGNHSTTTGYNLPGYIIDARIYPRALTQNEIKYLHNGFQPNIIVGQTIPSGAILDLSARGLTTAGIAQANGVVDRSGNGNHGQAYNGVAVVNDDEMGSCFSFDGINDYIQYNNLLSGKESVTLCVKFSVPETQTSSSRFFNAFSRQNSVYKGLSFYLYPSLTQIGFQVFNSDMRSEFKVDYNFLVNTKYIAILVVNHETHKIQLYVNAEMLHETEWSGDLEFHASETLKIGSFSSTQDLFKGIMQDLRIYPRALTASEVQQLADASLKKVTAVKKGSSEIHRVYYGSNLAYAKTAKHTMTISNDFVRKQLSKTTMSSNSRCVFISPAGNMFATDWSGKCVKIFDNTGTYIRSFTPLSGKIPYAIAGDDTYLYVCYWDSTNVYKYQYSGTDTPTLKATWTAPVTQNDCAIVYSGYLYVVSQQKQMYKINISTGAVTSLVTSTYPINAVGIDTKNNTIVTVQNGGMTTQYTNDLYAKIIVYNMSGTVLKTTELSGSYTSQVNGPQGLVVDPSGNLYLGGSYSVYSQYNQGLLVLDANHNVIHDISYSACPTFCYSFAYDSYHNRIVWVGSGYGARPYIFGISIPPVYSLTIE